MPFRLFRMYDFWRLLQYIARIHLQKSKNYTFWNENVHFHLFFCIKKYRTCTNLPTMATLVVSGNYASNNSFPHRSARICCSLLYILCINN